MIGVADELAANIESFLVGSAFQPDRVYVSAGEPAAPDPGCTEIAVWIDDILDQNQSDPSIPCLVYSQLTLRYRISWCYTENEDGSMPTESEHYTVALALYSLMATVWCGLVQAKGDGTLAGQNKCDQSSLGQLSVDQRSGGHVSATGSVTVPYDCSVGS